VRPDFVVGRDQLELPGQPAVRNWV